MSSASDDESPVVCCRICKPCDELVFVIRPAPVICGASIGVVSAIALPLIVIPVPRRIRHATARQLREHQRRRPDRDRRVRDLQEHLVGVAVPSSTGTAALNASVPTSMSVDRVNVAADPTPPTT
jgi:hypothetical protein